MCIRDSYLAIVTLAFGEIIKNIVNCLYVGVDSSGLHIGMTNSNALGLAEGGKVIMNGPMLSLIHIYSIQSARTASEISAAKIVLIKSPRFRV